MIELERTVRFTLGNDGTLADDQPVDNSHAAWPPMIGAGRHYAVTVACCGVCDPMTGYLINVQELDEIVRRVALPMMAEIVQHHQNVNDGLRRIYRSLQESVAGLQRVTWQLAPMTSMVMEGNQMAQVVLVQQYEFSAAHRLHHPDWSDEKNRAVFGKCNHAAGHGHNYQLEVRVAQAVEGNQSEVRPFATLDAIVQQHVMQWVDHKHLDVDVPELTTETSTVENITQLIAGWLAEPLAEAQLTLKEVRLWETAKTSCVYRLPLDAQK